MKLNQYYMISFTVFLFIISSCGAKKSNDQSGPPPAVPVTIAEVTTTEAVYNDEFPGIVSALNQINLTSQVSGYVTGVFFKDGAKVRKGQKLYSIDAQVYKANYQQAVADLQVQESNLVKAQKDADRYHELDKHDAIAKQQVDYADAALEATKKQVAASNAKVAAVGSNVRFASIYAPFSGTIGISQVKQGTAVVAGQTVMNTVSTDNPIAVDFAVDQKDIYHFIQLQQTTGNKMDSMFTIAFGTEVYANPGSISMIDRAVDPQTGTIKVRLVFPNDKGMLKAGMNTTIRVKSNAPSNSTLIPNQAITELLGEFFVYVVGDSSKVHQQKVVLGRQIGNNIIITEGLKPGEKIVVQGIQNLHEGSAVAMDSTNK